LIYEKRAFEMKAPKEAKSMNGESWPEIRREIQAIRAHH